jgi:hypothetical protein
MSVRIGWPTTHKYYAIKQGAQGSIQLKLKVVNDDNTPLVSYTGFTAKFSLFNSQGKEVQTFTQANNCLLLVPDSVNQEVVVTLIFKPVNTRLYLAGQKLMGDLKLTLPDGIETQYPYEMTLEVLRSFTK